MNELDIARLRAETPSSHEMIHFNNAGCSLMPQPVYEAVTRHLELEQEIGGYEAETAAESELEDFYDAFAELLGGHRDEIAYVENATRAWDMAFYSLPLKAGDRVLTAESEYVSNFLAFLHQAKRRDIEIDAAPCDGSGQVDLDVMERLIKPSTKLIALTHVPTQGGLVNPAKEVGEIARRHGLTYLLDACQSIGQMPINVQELGCHLLSGTGRKFLRGPRGTGFLYVAKSILSDLDPPFIDLKSANWLDERRYEFRADARRFENWESYVAGRLGLRSAVRYALNLGPPAIKQRIYRLADRLRAGLGELSRVTLQDLGREKCGIVTFTISGEDPQQTKDRLRKHRINVSVSSASSARIDFGRRGLNSVVRASVHYFNTEEEIDRFCKVLAL